jgi:hypothetical protein
VTSSYLAVSIGVELVGRASLVVGVGLGCGFGLAETTLGAERLGANGLLGRGDPSVDVTTGKSGSRDLWYRWLNHRRVFVRGAPTELSAN